MPRRSRVVALVLSLAGFLGLHRFYLGRFWTGLLMLVTLGGFGIWWIVDIYLVLTGKLRDGDKQELVWFGGGSHPETPDAVAPTLQPREASEQAQTSEAEPTRPDEETRGTAGMSTISLPGQTKVSTLQERFKSEFGLTLRVYDGRSFADPSATIGQVRKKRGATSIDIRRNTKVGNLEDRFMADFGIKVQIAGSDDSYLCDNDLTLAAALEEDERKLGRKDQKLKILPKIENTFKVKALIELFSVAEQPEDEGLLPNGILEAKTIWDASGSPSSGRIIALVKPYVACSFVADNMDDWRRLIRDENNGEFEADEIRVVDIDFSDGPLPLVSLECIFSLPLEASVTVEDIMAELEDDSWTWSGCIIPRWEFSESMGLEDLDLNLGEQNGVEVAAIA